MGVICQILIKRPREGFHRPGSKVSGIIKYVIDEPTEYKKIVLSFIGKGKCQWQVTTGSGKNRRTTTYTGTEEYFTEKINIIESKEKIIALKPGSYECPFEFLLPIECPSTYKDDTCTIKYEIQLKFVKSSFFSINKRFNTEINVQSYVNPTIIEGKTIFGLEKKLLKLFSSKDHKIYLKAAVSNTIFSIGEAAELEFTVTNDTNVKLTSVRTELIEHNIYTANCGTQKGSEEIISKLTKETPSVPENAIANMSTSIPMVHECFSIQNSRIISRMFTLKVTVRLPIPYVNDSVGIPFVIGERRREIVTEPAEEYLEDPPSYWEVMNEDDKIEGGKESGSSNSVNKLL